MKMLLLLALVPLFAHAAEDPFLWLEDIESARSLEWVKQHNTSTQSRLEKTPTFAGIKSDVTALLSRHDRLPAITLSNGFIYTFWQDDQHLRGVWERSTVASYSTGSPAWEVLLDLDLLDKTEGKDWVWKDAVCLEPAHDRCLVKLSPGGGDAVEMREFSVSAKSFVDGFRLPVSKGDVAWIDADTILVATDFGPGSMSSSGYPLVIKEWRRGTALGEAPEAFRGEPTDMSVNPVAFAQPGGSLVLFQRYLSFFESETFLRGSRTSLSVPNDAEIQTALGDRVLYILHSPLGNFTTGSLVAFSPRGDAQPELVFAPTATTFLSGSVRSGDDLLLNVLDNVRGRVLRAHRDAKGWTITPVSFGGDNGMASVTDASAFNAQYLATYLDYLTPTSQFVGDSTGVRLMRSSPALFDSSRDVTEQFEATSKDGTKIPYFIVHPRDQKRDGSNPTLLYGYGGFNVSMTPWYSGTVGKSWLERGGTYVVANIRGGGEFGPAWHEAARKEKHQNAFDDFIAVAEDLIDRGITSPRHLGIMGGSNGGLLMGAVTMQRPDLFNAVACEVPLLDMMRYYLLLAGASWIDEYGDPRIPAERAYILKYSPYQNARPGMNYPEIFFTTSTHDDRVHPGHARKMAALLESLGYGTYFFENNEGGHGGSATPEQQANLSALTYSYLWLKLAR